MKKNIYIALLLLLAVTGFNACSPEMDDAFDKSASERVSESIDSTRAILKAAKNGWRMAYYGELTYGGYNVFLKFSDDSVTVASEQVTSNHNAGIDTDNDAQVDMRKCTSHYKIEQSQGVVISLDEYNEIFHYFSDPNNTDQGSAGYGFEGDFEFRVIEATADKIVLKGKKHDTNIVMYAMDENTSWLDYYLSIANTEDYMKSMTYALTVSGDTVASAYISSYGRDLVFQYYNADGERVSTDMPYIVTPDGLEFYNPVTIGGVELSFIEKGTTDEFFYVKDHHDAQLWTYITPLADALREDMWFISYDNLGSFAKPYWDTFYEKLGKAGTNNTRSTLYYAFIGTYPYGTSSGSTTSVEGIHFSTDDGRPYQVLRFEGNEDGTEVKISRTDGDNSSLSKLCRNYYNKYGVKEALTPLTNGSRGRTFKITTDSERHPSYLTLTEVGNEANTITLSYSVVYYPFGDGQKDD